MPYDSFGRTPGQALRDREFDWAYLLGILLGVAALVCMLISSCRSEGARQVDLSPKLGMEPLGYTFGSDQTEIRYYVFVDPDTQIHYLVNDLGGMTPRLDSHGDTMGTHNDD